MTTTTALWITHTLVGLGWLAWKYPRDVKTALGVVVALGLWPIVVIAHYVRGSQ